MDLKIVETGEGGDVLQTASKKDLVVIEGLQNMPYLAMFGGNVEANTPSERLFNQQSFDWWGNSILMNNTPSMQMNARTERALRDTALTSRGRELIQQAVREDLLFMKEFCDVAIAVSIVGLDKIVIGVRLQERDNLQQRDYIYIWDATKQELDDEFLRNIKRGDSGVGMPSDFGFNYALNFVFI